MRTSSGSMKVLKMNIIWLFNRINKLKCKDQSVSSLEEKVKTEKD